MARRRTWRWARRELAELDPQRDHERIAHLSLEVRLGQPLAAAALYTIGFCRQVAVPSIARVIHRGGEGDVLHQARARNDLSLNFFGRFLSQGHSSPGGRAAIEELNRIHARFPIHDHELLYTLSGLVFEGPRFTGRLGVAVLTPEEVQANYLFWAGVAEQMEGMPPVPPYDDYLRWTLEYEGEHYAYSSEGRAVVDALIADFAARLPRPFRHAGKPLMLAAMDEHLRTTHRLPKPRIGDRTLALGGRAFVLSKALLPDPPDRSWTDAFVPDLARHSGTPGGTRQALARRA